MKLLHYLTLASAIAGVLAAPAPVRGQVASGSISGVVLDGQKAAVPNAKVTLINQAQGATVREVPSSGEGTFVFTPVLPGAYTLTVEASGFKKYSQQDITLYTGDKLGLPPVELVVGVVSDSITVEAEAVTLQTASAERSGVLTGTQMKELALVGRNFVELMKTVPGVSPDNTNSVNGQRSDSATFSIDGVTVMDTGSGWFSGFVVNTDNIAEFKLLSNSQQAEFGRSSGMNVSVVTKSGSRDFHGTGYWFLRNEWLNANSWDSNYYGYPRAMYRYRTQGFNLGGPVYLPGKFNSKRERLFFFAGLEFQRPRVVNPLVSRTVPTLRERQGDFSLTHDGSGLAVPIRNPLASGAPFAGNQIPQTQWHPLGDKVLKYFPEPNQDGINPTFNHQYQFEPKYKYSNDVYRIDYNISDSWRFYFRLIRSTTIQTLQYTSIYISPVDNPSGSIAGMGSLTTILSPTLTNEFSYGNSRNWFPLEPVSGSGHLRSVSGLSLPALYPDANPAGVIAGMAFGGIPNPPNVLFSGFPYDNENPTVNWTDHLSKVFARHALKAGLFIESSFKRQSASVANNGTYVFSRDSANPGDTNWDFSNALLGNFQYFQQANTPLKGYYMARNYEWYIQDNWRLRPNLTLDFGLRFVLIPNMYDQKNQLSGFNPAVFDPAQQVKLYLRARNPATGQIAAYHPVTGQYRPSTFIGAIVPGVGSADNGIVQAGKDYPRSLIDDTGLHLAPRFGLAWTPAGPSGRTVLRMGAGVFYERVQGNVTYPLGTNPPTIRVPAYYYGSFSTLGALTGTDFPALVGGVARDAKVPVVYNFNAGAQRQLPFRLLLDVSYVGSLSRHLSYQHPWNTPAWGSAWLPQYQDPTVLTGPKFDGTTTLPVNFTRPYVGYGGAATGGSGQITIFGGSASYNSLQVSANRRMSSGLQVGLAYTWSKALGTASSSFNSVVHPTNVRKAEYGVLTFDRTQILSFNYTYNLPAFKGHVVGRAILNGWQVSGITSLCSGAPGTLSYGQVNVGATALNRMITGSEPMAPRVVLTGNPNLSPADRTLYRWLDTSVVRPAVKGSQGMDSGPRTMRGPGVNNWDVSVFRKIRFTSNEQRYVQLRFEMFNAFNHTQWSSVNGAAQFDASGNITNLATAANRFGFGALNGVRPPRRIQLAAKVYF